MKTLKFLLIMATVCAVSVFAQSAKNAVQASTVALVPSTTSSGGWVPILNASLHTSQQKDLIFGASVECGLYTRTRVKTSGGIEDVEYAAAGVRLRVVVDPGPNQRIAEPGTDPNPADQEDETGVTYCSRKQQLSAKLQGIINNLTCFPGGVFDPNAEGCSITPEEIEVILETMDANSFFFVLDDLGAGVHQVQVQAKIDTAVSSADAEAKALVGKGTVTVEEVRLVKGADLLTP